MIEKILDKLSSALVGSLSAFHGIWLFVMIFTLLFFGGSILLVRFLYKELRNDRKEILEMANQHATKMELLINNGNTTLLKVGESIKENAVSNVSISKSVDNNSDLIKILIQKSI